MSVVTGRASPQPQSAQLTALGQLGLLVALGGSLVVVLDFSIVNVALRALSVAMGVSTTTAEWVITAYALTFGGLLVGVSEHLAAAYNALGRVDEACERYERALHLKERQVGVKRSELVGMQVNLAKIYIGYSRLGPAQELLRHIIMNGCSDGPEFDEALGLLASLYDRSGRSKEAAEIRSRIASTVE